MPTYQGQISEEGLIDLVEYHQESSTSDYRVQQTLTTTQLPEANQAGQQRRRGW